MNILKSIQRSTFCSAAFTSVVCLLGAAQVSAAEPAGTHSVTVNYRDLNLSTIQGATALYQRLTRAARSVCDGPETGVHAYQEWMSCYQAAMADAAWALQLGQSREIQIKGPDVSGGGLMHRASGPRRRRPRPAG